MIRSPDVSALLSLSLCASFKDVEHSCLQCGTAVEDGRPFCPQCRAPQITVKIAVPDAVLSAGSNAAPDEVYPGTLQAGHFGRPVVPATMDTGAAVRAAIKAGVLGVFISIITVPLLGTLLAGVLAVYFYRRENGFVLPAALGLRLGGAAGVVAFAIGALALTISIFVFHGRQKYSDFFLKAAQKFGANVADPEIQASIHNLLTPVGLVITFFFMMIVVVALASIGGALASTFLRPRNPRA